MDQKLANSVLAYKTKLNRLSENQRRTLSLPAGYIEIPIANGRRMRLETGQPATDQYISKKPTNMDDIYVSYPSGPTSTIVHAQSMECLGRGKFINDEIINIMIKMSYGQLVPRIRQTKIQVCDSFMYAQLTKGTNPKDVHEKTATLKANFERVRGYRRVVGFGLNEATLVPVEEDHHWFLLLVFIQTTGAIKQGHIAIMDSLPGTPRWHTARVIKQFIEYKVGDIAISTQELDVLKQTNGYDCGLHVVENAKRSLHYLGQCVRLDMQELQATLTRPTEIITREGISETLAQLRKAKMAADTIPPRAGTVPAKTANTGKLRQNYEGKNEENLNDITNNSRSSSNDSKIQKKAEEIEVKCATVPKKDAESPTVTRDAEPRENEILILQPNEETHLIANVIACNESAEVWHICPETAQNIVAAASSRATSHKRVLLQIGATRISIRRGTHIVRAVKNTCTKEP